MAYASYFPSYVDDRKARLKRLKRLAWLIDGQFRFPGTGYRFGINSIIGLLPVGGDAVLAVLSSYIIVEAARLGLPRHLLGRMIANVAIETLAGTVPLLGDAFDMTFKANLRNLAIIDQYFQGVL